MSKVLKTLFAIDFASSSKEALQALRYIQGHYGVELYLMHVITSFWRSWLSSGLHEKEQLQRLESWSSRLREQQLAPDHLIIKTGTAASAIISEANKLDTDLILIGGHVTKKRFGTEKTAMMVVRHASQSVLLCKNHVFNKVLCGVDGSKSSARALNQAINVCRANDLSLTIASVLPRLDFNPLGMPNEDIEAREQAYREAKIIEINEFLDHFDFSGVQTNRCYPWGTTSRVMLNMAFDFDYDLIVIGATGQSILSNVLMGGTAERILKAAPCSLLITR